MQYYTGNKTDFMFYDTPIFIEKNNREQHSYLFYVVMAIKMLKEYRDINEAIKSSMAQVNDRQVDNWAIYKKIIYNYEKEIIGEIYEGGKFLLSFYPIAQAKYFKPLDIVTTEIANIVQIRQVDKTCKYTVLDDIEYHIPYYELIYDANELLKNKDYLMKKYYNNYFDFKNIFVNKSSLVMGYDQCETHVFLRFLEALANLCVMYNMYTKTFFVGPHPMSILKFYDKVSGDQKLRLYHFYQKAFSRQVMNKIINYISETREFS